MKQINCLAIVYESGGVFIDTSIRSEINLSGLIKPNDNARIVRVTVSEAKKRSLDSNALQAVWIREVADHTGESIAYVRATVKRDLGMPILRFEAVTPEEIHIAKMMNATLAAINYDLMNPKQQLNVIKMFSVTSAMSTKQHKKMLDDMACHFADKLGLILVSNK